MYNLIISIPLITAIIILIFGRKIGIQGVKYLSLLNMSKILIISIIYLIQEIITTPQSLITQLQFNLIDSIIPRPKVEELRRGWSSEGKSILKSEELQRSSIRWPIELIPHTSSVGLSRGRRKK